MSKCRCWQNYIDLWYLFFKSLKILLLSRHYLDKVNLCKPNPDQLWSVDFNQRRSSVLTEPGGANVATLCNHVHLKVICHSGRQLLIASALDSTPLRSISHSLVYNPVAVTVVWPVSLTGDGGNTIREMMAIMKMGTKLENSPLMQIEVCDKEEHFPSFAEAKNEAGGSLLVSWAGGQRVQGRAAWRRPHADPEVFIGTRVVSVFIQRRVADKQKALNGSRGADLTLTHV